MPRWVFLLVVGSSVAIAIVLGVVWYVIGGWPRDHDRYGEVAIPGQKMLELPKGEVRLSFEGAVSGGGETRSLEDPPEGLKVRVGAPDHRPLKVESVPSSLYSISSGDTGHEPFGKIDVPTAGRYQVRTTAQGAGFGAITAGPPLWNPLDSRAFGAIAVAVAALLVLLIIEVPILLAVRRRSTA